MDAKERLRRYLEQRREMGESELILDGMPVDDVLSMLGASQRAAPLQRRPRAPLADVPQIAEVAQHPQVPQVSEEMVSPSAGSNVPSNVGEALDGSGIGGDDLPQSGEPSIDSSADAGSIDPPGPRPAVPVAPPAVLPRAGSRDDTVGTGANWREVLRGDAVPLPLALDGLDTTGSGDDSTSSAVPTWLTALGITLGISAGQSALRPIDAGIAALPTLDALADATRACTRCELYRTATNAVPGEGDPNADVVCVGEAPGQNEDEQGRPFVGAAGNLLNKILAAIALRREDVFICNVLKHRPPGNRDPLPDEVRACEPYLRRQLELVRPRVILALGRFAAQSLLQTTTPIGKLRGAVHRYHGIPLIVTYHPAALLRNEAWKRPTWEDVKLARRVLDASRAASGGAPADTVRE